MKMKTESVRDEDSMLWRIFHLAIFLFLSYYCITDKSLLDDLDISDIIVAFLFLLAAISTIIVGAKRIEDKESSKASNFIDYSQIVISVVFILSLIYNVVK